jgi:hypothetical protein
MLFACRVGSQKETSGKIHKWKRLEKHNAPKKKMKKVTILNVQRQLQEHSKSVLFFTPLYAYQIYEGWLAINS